MGSSKDSRYPNKRFEVQNFQNNTHFSRTLQCDFDLFSGYHWILSPHRIEISGINFYKVGRHFRFYLPQSRSLKIRLATPPILGIAFDFWVSIFSSKDPFYELPMVPATFHTATNPVTWGSGVTNLNVDIGTLDRIMVNLSCNNILITELHALRTDTNDKTTAIPGSDLIDCVVEDNAGIGGDFFGLRIPASHNNSTEKDGWAARGIFWKGEMIQDYIFYPTDGNLEFIGANSASNEYLWVFVKGLVL